MSNLTIEHTPAGGTLLLGTARGDGVSDVLRARPGGVYWKWSRNIGTGAWYVPRTRGEIVPTAGIEKVGAALVAAGHTVKISTSDDESAVSVVAAESPTTAPAPLSPFAPGVPVELTTSDYVDSATIAKWLRAHIKAMRAAGQANGGVNLPADAKVTVRTDKYAGGSSIDVTIWGSADWVYVSPGAPEGPEYYHQPMHGGYTLAAQVAAEIIRAAMARFNWNRSDIMTDYHDVRFYGDVSLAVTGTDYGSLRGDSDMAPVAIGSTVDRFAAREAFDLTPYAVARAEEAAHAEDAARTAEAARVAAEIDQATETFAAELDSLDTLAGTVEQETTAAVVAAAEAEQAETVAEITHAADALGEVALAEETITRAPDETSLSGYEGRSVSVVWVLDRHDDGSPRELTTLHVGYSKGRGFYGSLNRVTRSERRAGGFVGELSSPFDATRLTWSLPAARFSAKGLDAATTLAVAHVQHDDNRAAYLAQFLLSSQKARQ